MRNMNSKTAAAIAVTLTACGLAARPAQAQQAARSATAATLAGASATQAATPGRAAPSAAERAAMMAGGHIVHEIDGKTIVVRGPAAAATAAALMTGATAIEAGSGPLRLRGAQEDAAIAALSPAQQAQLQQIFGAVRDGAPSEDDATTGPASTSRARTMMASSMATSSAASSSSAASAAAASTAATSSAASATGAAAAAAPLPGTEHEPASYDTSEFLYGRIAVNVVFVQSTQSGHDWSSDDKNDAVSDLVGGLDMWAQQYPQANLSFHYRTFTTTTDHQPIKETSDTRSVWIEQGMEQLGFGHHGPSDGAMQHYDNVYDLDNDARNSLGTDWAFTCFMVRAATGIGDAWNAVTSGTNGTFGFMDGKAAFTMVGGPYMVMPYSSIWGIHFWNSPILTHEFGHVFYALDEYPAYAAQGHDATERSGYFHVQNGNIQGAGALTNDTCIMRGNFAAVMDYVLDHIVSIFTFGATSSWDYHVCGFTLGQMGFLDADGNGRLDVFDTPPAITAPQIGINTTTNQVWAFIDVEVGATPNQNDYASRVHPASAKHDVTIDSVAGVWFSVDGNPWVPVALNQNPPCGQAFLMARPIPASEATSYVTIYVSTATGNHSMQTFPVSRPAPPRRWWPIMVPLTTGTP